MLYFLLYPLRDHFSPLNVFRYISFRAAGAAVTALLVAFIVGPMILRRLQHMQIHQVVRAGTPDSHAGKGKTVNVDLHECVGIGTSCIEEARMGRVNLQITHSRVIPAIYSSAQGD